MKKRKMWLLLSLTAMSTIFVLNISGQPSRPAPPTMLRVQLSQSQSMPVQPSLPPPAPPKPLPVIPDPVAPDFASSGTGKSVSIIQPTKPGKFAINLPPMFTNHPPALATTPLVFTNHQVIISPVIFQQTKSTNEATRL